MALLFAGTHISTLCNQKDFEPQGEKRKRTEDKLQHVLHIPTLLTGKQNPLAAHILSLTLNK